MNPMIAALQHVRNSDGSSYGKTSGNDDMAEYWKLLKDLSAKVDKILEVLGGAGDSGTQSAPQGVMEKPQNGNDGGN